VDEIIKEAPMRAFKRRAANKALYDMEKNIDAKFSSLTTEERKRILALFLLDDWGQVAQMALPLV